ncbi:MAG: hypothetical protein MJE12_17530 [Alphaproteobacteria bacterium]|nr:hypothetical protein [Alphaproteobacteria bacterium]
MKRFLAMIALTASLACYSGGTQAGYKYHHHHHGHGGAYVAAGIIGGALLLGTLLSLPRYRPYPPPPVYYAPPRPPVCYREDVYRYLPDGRIQWGVRTSCY